ncbi:GDP-mannose 4,6-dehydratase [Paramagnetospirillum kuznetsovii]|uniref:GDP-mannose 4,6-dehydratase n=1 Tax=Paramagnetospirillum kuznetsovii TaxID=2053833 RepID=A0A364NXT9_9PROT|nr:GDP-mannose 4,6-dehydratase [Paramagnetospirillum kuznetsovii]RAU21810.1 GDP-mannose 4,6-dehydratase [Paramagnetospirillum kuznetsovii]
MLKALIIGISGQDGSYLARHLLGLGYHVTGSSRNDRPFLNLDRLGLSDQVEMVRLDPTDTMAVTQLLERVRPDEVYALSGLTSVARSFADPAGAFAANAGATSAILEALRANRGIRCFFAGSSECFGDTQMPANCDTPFYPRSPYATAKAFTFWQVRTYRQAFDMHVSTGILFSHESPLRGADFVTRKIISSASRIARGSDERLSLGDISPIRDWGWAPDFVEAMHLMLRREQAEDFIIATGRSAPLAYLVERAFAVLGLDWRDHVDYRNDAPPTNIVRRSYADISATQDRLGWTARTDVDGVVDRLTQCEKAGEPG